MCIYVATITFGSPVSLFEFRFSVLDRFDFPVSIFEFWGGYSVWKTARLNDPRSCSIFFCNIMMA
jgi:hypothetical protein